VSGPLSPAHHAADTSRVSDDSRVFIRRAGGWALVGGLTIAALTAVAALLGGSFDETELRVILTSIGFAVSSATAAVGATQRLRASAGLRALGTATMVLAVLAFVLLGAGLWTNMDDWGSEGIWRAFGCTALLAIAGAHACVVLGARRPSDSDAVSFLVFLSLAFAIVDTLGGIAPISGLMESFDEGVANLLAAVLVLLVLTSVLPPILRRLQRAPAEAPTTALERFAREVEALAVRIDELNQGPAVRAPEIRREVERLRALARSFQA
jgi:hypothetical protein